VRASASRAGHLELQRRPRLPVTHLGIPHEQQDLTRLRELEREHQARVVRIVIQIERQLAEGAEPLVVDAPPRLLRIIVGAGHELFDAGEVGIRARDPMLGGEGMGALLRRAGRSGERGAERIQTGVTRPGQVVDDTVPLHLLRDLTSLEYNRILWWSQHAHPHPVNAIQLNRPFARLKELQLSNVVAAQFQVVECLSDASRAGVIFVLAETEQRRDPIQSIARSRSDQSGERVPKAGDRLPLGFLDSS
jgi:hypothetical protein